MFGRPEIECRQCDGEGVIWNNADLTSGQCIDCPDCNGEGWREATDEETADMASDAWSDLCSSEPPMSYLEREAIRARRDADWGVF